MKHCMIYGMQSRAALPRMPGFVGTVLHPRSFSPSFSTMTFIIRIAKVRFMVSCGKKNMPTP